MEGSSLSFRVAWACYVGVLGGLNFKIPGLRVWSSRRVWEA